ncbi:hypothetical protein ACVRY7_01515 [Streptococcus ictaluri]|uniref:Gram-positive signal peptide protein, YSIRK family n=1 Tax=Streptococcus ictaluri 707-05 TaxID=764299 RepID=G5JZH0_9STRE|nr:hypothetical protein [Streptococcus ictaluri]EHI70766.1 hypothetical protein STRIC_0681 [Streptococcus ictaluri 707-05]
MTKSSIKNAKFKLATFAIALASALSFATASQADEAKYVPERIFDVMLNKTIKEDEKVSPIDITTQLKYQRIKFVGNDPDWIYLNEVTNQIVFLINHISIGKTEKKSVL